MLYFNRKVKEQRTEAPSQELMRFKDVPIVPQCYESIENHPNRGYPLLIIVYARFLCT